MGRNTYGCIAGSNYGAVWFKSGSQIGKGAKRCHGVIGYEAQVWELFPALTKICMFAPVCSHIIAHV